MGAMVVVVGIAWALAIDKPMLAITSRIAKPNPTTGLLVSRSSNLHHLCLCLLGPPRQESSH
jgi:hypothetical protein